MKKSFGIEFQITFWIRYSFLNPLRNISLTKNIYVKINSKSINRKSDADLFFFDIADQIKLSSAAWSLWLALRSDHYDTIVVTSLNLLIDITNKYLTHFSIEQGKLGLANITEHGWLLIIGRLDRTWMFWPAKSSITHWGPAIGRCWATTSHKLKIFLKNYWDDWDSWAISLVGDPLCSVICFDFFNKMKIFEIMKGDKAR